MTIWCAVILAVGLIIAAVIVAIGLTLGGVCSSDVAVSSIMPDDMWDDYQERMTKFANRYVTDTVGSMFND